MICEHISCTPSKGVWLPLIVHVGVRVHLKKHLYCENCGIIKNSGDMAKSIGYYTDVLIAIRDYIRNRYSTMPKFTKTQVRLIAKELESNELFIDTYGSCLNIQMDKFVEKVKKYRPDLTEDFIRTFLRH